MGQACPPAGERRSIASGLAGDRSSIWFTVNLPTSGPPRPWRSPTTDSSLRKSRPYTRCLTVPEATETLLFWTQINVKEAKPAALHTPYAPVGSQKPAPPASWAFAVEDLTPMRQWERRQCRCCGRLTPVCADRHDPALIGPRDRPPARDRCGAAAGRPPEAGLG